jgi:hypothetical protein
VVTGWVGAWNVDGPRVEGASQTRAEAWMGDEKSSPKQSARVLMTLQTLTIMLLDAPGRARALVARDARSGRGAGRTVVARSTRLGSSLGQPHDQWLRPQSSNSSWTSSKNAVLARV